MPYIAFQGELGAYSHAAVQHLYPSDTPLPCATFEDAMQMVQQKKATAAVLPVENSQFGRVADLHQLLPDMQLHIVGEYFMPIAHQLLVLPHATREGIRKAYSHPQALGQCRITLQKMGIKPCAADDTAASARRVSETQDTSIAAVASHAAAERYGLISLGTISDSNANTTRFLILQDTPAAMPAFDMPCVMSFIFRTRNVPAALYKALGGFATEGINLSKIESYQPDGLFAPTLFYAEADAHPAAESTKRAFHELNFFSTHIQIIGAYAAHRFRHEIVPLA